MMELSSFVLMLLKMALIITVLVVGFFIYSRTRTFSKGTSGVKMSFNKRRIPYNVEISLSKNQHFNPTIIEMMVTNTGTKEIDLYAPVITFKRWFSKRKFKVLRVEHSEIYPILVESGKSSYLNISLEQFYNTAPELQLAFRMSVEMKDRSGKIFKSQTIRLKWF